MKRPIGILSLTILITIVAIPLVQHSTAQASAPTTQPAAVDLGNTVCPVSDEPVGDSKLTVTYQGVIYHFCCEDCPVKFQKDPQTYIKAINADPGKYGVKKGS